MTQVKTLALTALLALGFGFSASAQDCAGYVTSAEYYYNLSVERSSAILQAKAAEESIESSEAFLACAGAGTRSPCGLFSQEYERQSEYYDDQAAGENNPLKREAALLLGDAGDMLANICLPEPPPPPPPPPPFHVPPVTPPPPPPPPPPYQP